MDEILIEEKRYVSSKQAAKITGYAKDYIGQLCREGRVPARLVGRSWYVLESAIQDHRFGNPETDTKNVTPEVAVPIQPPQSWGSFHYESAQTEVLPSINRMQEKGGGVAEVSATEDRQQEEAPQTLNDAWDEWFDRVSSAKPIAKPIFETPVIADTREVYENSVVSLEEDQEDIMNQPDDENVSVPLKIINYQQTVDSETLPESYREREEADFLAAYGSQGKRSSRGASRVIRSCSVAVAAIFVALAVIGSGYFDKYIISYNQVSILSGLLTYDRQPI